MRAIRKRESAPGLTLEEVPVPTPAADEVLVRIEAASICGTDLHISRWDKWSSDRVQPPLTLGHELCGTVAATGSGVRDIDEGDYVSAESHVTCGVCFHCRTGKAHMCELTRILGVDRDGGFADYVAVPASVVWKNDRTKLPPEIACLQEPFGNAVFATSTQDLAGPPLREEDYLILSTIHSAKGCEWDCVYVIHAADGNIPSDMATGTADEVEEERRLFYVALTRARDFLEVCFPLKYYAKKWSTGDRHSMAQLTRFLPESLMKHFERISLEPMRVVDGPSALPPASAEIRKKIAAMWA